MEAAPDVLDELDIAEGAELDGVDVTAMEVFAAKVATDDAEVVIGNAPEIEGEEGLVWEDEIMVLELSRLPRVVT